MNDAIIHVEGLRKRYALRHQNQGKRYVALRDIIADRAKALFQRNGNSARERHNREDFWALRGINFDVKRGEVLGIIGRNGAGKTTLLKILSRITEPTEGRVRLKGRVASLLEVGTGFHPELTGRENIYLNGAILGMSRAEIKGKFDEIVAFAETERFLDTPVKRYSSGMYVRLAFAVAAHLEPEILLVDEVLAVGDAEFQKKCLGKMQSVSTKEGRTVLFVSHNMEAVQQLCQRAILIEQGQIRNDAASNEVVQQYLKNIYNRMQQRYEPTQAEINQSQDNAILTSAELLDSNGEPCNAILFGEPFAFRMRWHHRTLETRSSAYALEMHDDRDRFLFAVNTLTCDLDVGRTGRREVTCSFPHNVLVPGSYYVAIGCWARPRCIHFVEHCLRFEVLTAPYRNEEPFNIFGGPIFAMKSSWSTNEL
jgi:homopolymeric O-antigen transport system ATP-binding protein